MLRKVGSAGRPLFYTDVRVVRPDMSDVATGEVGEIVVRGPNVMRGYWNRPEATEAAITHGGWLHTGDAAKLDEEGYVYVVDRLKDMITTAGENVYPAEIERTLREHPAVDDAAVVGIADPSVGQAPVAFVVTLRSVGSGELVAWCAERLASFKVPRRIRFVDDLPRNPAGKVQKHHLREMAAQADS